MQRLTRWRSLASSLSIASLSVVIRYLKLSPGMGAAQALQGLAVRLALRDEPMSLPGELLRHHDLLGGEIARQLRVGQERFGGAGGIEIVVLGALRTAAVL